MPEAGTSIKVPVAVVAAEAYRSVFGRLNLLLDLAWLPLLCVLAVTILPDYLKIYRGLPGLPTWRGDGLGLGAGDLLQAFVGLFAFNAFAVRWHQSMLFSSERQSPQGIFRGAWIRFILYSLLLYLISAGLVGTMLVASSKDTPLYVAPVAGVVVLLLWFTSLRCSLLFPAAAYGRPMSFKESWQALGGNTWRIFACGLVACIPVIMIFAVALSGVFVGFHLDRLTDEPMPLGFFLLRSVVDTCLSFLVVALGASVLSSFYRRIVLRGLGVF
jgi:hypothetical protein